MKYRKPGAVVEAMQWDGTRDRWLDLVDAFGGDSLELATVDGNPVAIFIRTRGGDLRLGVNDWIIQDAQGELIPCTPDVFRQTYEEADNL